MNDRAEPTIVPKEHWYVLPAKSQDEGTGSRFGSIKMKNKKE
jgi:hypothetical protein